MQPLGAKSPVGNIKNYTPLPTVQLRHERAPSGMLELWERVQVEWEKIEPEVCQNLIESMPRRVAAVVKAKGGHTKY